MKHFTNVMCLQGEMTPLHTTWHAELASGGFYRRSKIGIGICAGLYRSIRMQASLSNRGEPLFTQTSGLLLAGNAVHSLQNTTLPCRNQFGVNNKYILQVSDAHLPIFRLKKYILRIRKIDYIKCILFLWGSHMISMEFHLLSENSGSNRII